MKKTLQVVILLLLLLAALGVISFKRFESNLRARRQTALLLAKNCEAGHLTYRDFHRKVGFPYTASSERLSRVTSAYKQLHLGLTMGDVLTTLGEPDHAQAGVSKQIDHFYSCSWMYELKTPEDLANYKNNIWVELFFDVNGKLMDKDAVNVSGIPNRHLPGESMKTDKPLTE